MRAIFYYLMRSPAANTTLLSVIDAATQSGALSTPNVKYAEAIKLPYLVAVIKEAMRLHPSVGLTMPRVVPAGGADIGGYFVPEGYRVGINGAVVHYDKGVFGEDAETFNPERWFRDEALNMDRHMIQFGAGARTCIGKNVSVSLLYH
jgi:cytochrome P450